MPKGQQSESETLDEKIKRIRKKNEEIEKRRLEVEADKQSAAKLNALVQLSTPKEEDWPPPREYTVEDEENPKRTVVAHEKQDRYINFSDKTNTQGSRPPPDPVYRFLADAERDPVPVASNERNLRHRSRLANKGRTREPKNRMGVPQGPKKKLANYEAWREERNQIDQERINRQRTAEGQWRREWDNQKSEEDWKGLKNEKQKESSSANQSTPSWKSKSNGTTTVSTGGTSVQKSQHLKGPSSSYIDRNVKSNKSSIQISFSNDSPMSTRVMPKRAIGSGRVGPHQKRRVSFEDHEEREGPNSCELDVSSTLEAKHETTTIPARQPKTAEGNVEKAKPSQVVEIREQGQEEEPKPRRYKEPRSRKRGAGKREALVARRRLPAPFGLEQPESHLPQAHEPEGDESWEDADSDGATADTLSQAKKFSDTPSEGNLSLNSQGIFTSKETPEVEAESLPTADATPPFPGTFVEDAQTGNLSEQAETTLSFKNTLEDANLSCVDNSIKPTPNQKKIEQTDKSALETLSSSMGEGVDILHAAVDCTLNLTAEPPPISPTIETPSHTTPAIPSDTSAVHSLVPESVSPESIIQAPLGETVSKGSETPSISDSDPVQKPHNSDSPLTESAIEANLKVKEEPLDVVQPSTNSVNKVHLNTEVQSSEAYIKSDTTESKSIQPLLTAENENFHLTIQSASEVITLEDQYTTNESSNNPHDTLEQTAATERAEDCSQKHVPINSNVVQTSEQEITRQMVQNQENDADNTSKFENIALLPDIHGNSTNRSGEEGAAATAAYEDADTSVETVPCSPHKNATDSNLLNCTDKIAD